ncbi:glutamate receptor 2.2-like [Cucumis melo]|uniref:Glutamate receptor n=1 Tax=Cucumis melo TaxID=3656 RepID=A0ABM3KM67_CUCME|nr:glutamate receptor 2.2-like [Cucumis melo]
MVELWSCIVCGADQIDKQTSIVNVGVILDSSSWVGKMGLSCINLSLSDFYSSHPHYNTKILLHIIDSKDDLLLAASQALELIEKSEVKAILGPESSFQAPYIIQLSEKFKVPLISFAPPPPPPSTFSYLTSPYLLRAYNHFSQIYAIRDIIKTFEWKQIVTIYQDDEFGKSVVLDLIHALQEEEVNTHVYRINPGASVDEIREELEMLKNKEQATIFIVHMVHSLASHVFTTANEIGITRKGYAWILADAITSSLNSINYSTLRSMQGFLGVKPFVPKTIELDNFTIRWRKKFLQENPNLIQYYPNPDVFGLWAYDSTWALAIAAERNVVSGIPQNGTTFMESLSMVRFKGLSGEFSFGQSKAQPPYYQSSQNLQIVNVIGDGDISTVGYWTPKMNLTGEYNRNVTLRPIIWPGYSIQQPTGWIPFNPMNRLKIGVPMLKRDKKYMAYSFMSNHSIVDYCLKIFEVAAKKLPYAITYDFFYFDGPYDDLILSVYRRKYDAAVGDITILANRSMFVDFSLPFTEAGVAVIVPVIRDDLVDPGWLFLKPLSLKLWITSFSFFVFLGFVVWILEHENNEDFCCGPIWHQIATGLWGEINEQFIKDGGGDMVLRGVRPSTELHSKLNVMVLGIQHLVPYDTLEQLNDLLTKGSRKGGVDAAIDEIPYMKLFLGIYGGNYTMTVSQYSTGGSGFAFPLGSTLVDDISKALLNMTQVDKEIKAIDKTWFGNDEIKKFSSSDDSYTSSSIDLSYFKSLFIITASATILALTLYLFRYSFDLTTIWTRIIATVTYQINIEPPVAAIEEEEASPNTE